MPETIPDIPEEAVAHLAASPEEAYKRLQDGKLRSVIDVRIPGAAEDLPLHFGEDVDILVQPFMTFPGAGEVAAQLPENETTLVVCATSRMAKAAAAALEGAGADVLYLVGGTRHWDQFMDVRVLRRQDGEAIIQVSRPGRGDLSYVIVADGEAVVIDPLRKIETYQSLLAEEHASLAWVLDTHAHADHISGGPALADWAGVPYYLHPYDAIHPVDMLPAVIPFDPLTDGQELSLRSVKGRVVWFPGHTLGMVMYSCRAAGAHLLLSGDGVFLDSIGRPDLGGKAEGWANLLYESVTQRLPAEAAGDTVILPGHFSSFSTGREGDYSATYAEVRRQNSWLDAGERDDFLQRVLANLPYVPEEYIEMKRINAGLSEASEELALELEAGPNLCAVSG